MHSHQLIQRWLSICGHFLGACPVTWNFFRRGKSRPWITQVIWIVESISSWGSKVGFSINNNVKNPELGWHFNRCGKSLKMSNLANGNLGMVEIIFSLLVNVEKNQQSLLGGRVLGSKLTRVGPSWPTLTLDEWAARPSSWRNEAGSIWPGNKSFPEWASLSKELKNADASPSHSRESVLVLMDALPNKHV